MFALYLLLCSSSVFAESNWKTSANADLKAEGLHYPESIAGTQNHEERLSLRAPLGLRYKKKWRVRVQPFVQFSPGNSSSREKSLLELPEAYLQFQKNRVTAQLGVNTVTWGPTDAFNPLDVVNQRVYFDPLNSQKRGSPMALIKTDFSPFQFEAVYIPKQKKALLPGENSRWLPREVYGSQSFGSSYSSATILLPKKVQYSYSGDLELDNAFHNNFGARAQLQLAGVDLSLVGYDGVASTPTVSIVDVSGAVIKTDNPLVLQVDEGVQLQANYYRQRMGGASAVIVAGDTLIKAAGAYTKLVTKRHDLPTDIQEYVLGFERNFWGATALLQGTYSQQKTAADGAPTSLGRMFDRGVMAGLRYAPEKWSVIVSGLYDTKYYGVLGHMEVGYKISDPCEVKLSGDLLSGQSATPIGTFKKNSRAIAALTVRL